MWKMSLIFSVYIYNSYAHVCVTHRVVHTCMSAIIKSYEQKTMNRHKARVSL